MLVAPLKERMRKHMNSIKSGSDTTVVSRHFKECNNSNIGALIAQGIEHVTLGQRGGNLQTKLLQAEVKWIYKLHTRQPQGLNCIFDISCYISILWNRIEMIGID
ncbi:hypothetical protein XELAEV_18016303mg [Xenopus laevis]|uniref:Uncharacterized protein n=1 Tax=Xenopus laevis TaxID=8355 RepID=A0A974DK08_XENLA|nr:hypothetical protein XELAEV_18016303mg [Xenopus laevis]